MLMKEPTHKPNERNGDKKAEKNLSPKDLTRTRTKTNTIVAHTNTENPKIKMNSAKLGSSPSSSTKERASFRATRSKSVPTPTAKMLEMWIKAITTRPTIPRSP